jgi:hypothetical protein
MPKLNNTTKTTDKPTDGKEHRSDNTGLAKVAVQCSADTFVVNQSLVLRINICGENRQLRQARNRYRQVENPRRSEKAKGLTTYSDRKEKTKVESRTHSKKRGDTEKPNE